MVSNANVVIYTTEVCPYCQNAKELLKRLNIPFKEIRVDDNLALRQEMEQKSGRRTVPQIFINDKPIGGYDDLNALHQKGKLQDLLSPKI